MTNSEVSILSRVSAAATIRRFLEDREYEQTTELCLIMRRHGSDKGLGWHNYTPLYSRLFEPLLGAREATIFEMGIGTNKPDAPSTMGARGRPGASLRAWAEWLPNAEIYGGDIEREILFQEGRIRTFCVDQRSSDDIGRMWDAVGAGVTFEVIIDDGLHTAAANDTFICASHRKLKAGGVYIIEDVIDREVEGLRGFLDKYRRWFRSVEMFDIPSASNPQDNRLVVLQK